MNRDTLRNVLNGGIKSLSNSPTPRLDAELLLCYVLNVTRTELITKDDMILDCDAVVRYKQLLELRFAGSPVKYITGSCEFMGLDFYVNENVLIPRPDTEILVESVIEHFPNDSVSCIIDIGTGSGCIAVSLKHYLKDAEVTAIDISEEALAVAKRNADANNANIRLIKSDLFSGISSERFDCIVSNPPYIPTSDISGLPIPVQYEPTLALDGGFDGLIFYRRIASQANKFLKPGGMMFFEIGSDQAAAVRGILLENDYVNIEIKKDYAGLDRVVICRAAE